MSGTETLTVRADEVRVGDRWHDAEENADVRCLHGPRPSIRPEVVRVHVAIESGGDGRTTRVALAYIADEPLTVTRALPPTDEEHEAAARGMVEADSVGDYPELAAVLRLLDVERAKVRGIENTLRNHEAGLAGQATALAHVRTLLGRKP